MDNTYHVSVPQLGEGIHYVKVRKILREMGEWVDEDSDLVEIETDKATYEVPSPASGYVSKILCKAGEQLNIGEALFELKDVKSQLEENEPPEQQQAQDVFHRSTTQKRKGEQLQPTNREIASYTLPPQQIELISRLHSSKDIVIPATIEKQISWDKIEEIRRNHRAKSEVSDTPSSLAIISYAVAQSMHKFEKFRAKIDDRNQVTINQESIVGIALSLANDILVTPAISVSKLDQEQRVFDEISKQIKAFQNNPDIAQSQYHSVSISSMSALGITRATPVVVHPAVATLFIGAPFKTRTDSNEKICNLVLSFDHRLINGAYAAKFLNDIEKSIKRLHKQGLQYD